MWNNKKDLGLQILGFYGYGGRQPGGFLESLLTTWNKADLMNRSRLYMAFPELGKLMKEFWAKDPKEFATWIDSLED